MIKLNKNLGASATHECEETVDSTSSFFQKAATLHKDNPKFRNSVVVCMLKAMIAKSSSNHLHTKVEEKMLDFFRYLRTLSPQAYNFVSANTGLDTKGVSDRWLRKLNSKDRGTSVFKSDLETMHDNIKVIISERKSDNDSNEVTFSIAIDATKVPMSLNINTARKCIMVGAFPHHMIATHHLDKNEITKLLKMKSMKMINTLCNVPKKLK